MNTNNPQPIPVYPFIGKVISLPTKTNADSFRAFSFSSNKTFTLIYDKIGNSKFEIGDAVRCDINVRDSNTLVIVNTPLFDVACDRDTFLTLLCRALGNQGFGARKASILYDYLSTNGITGGVRLEPMQVYNKLSIYASKYEKSLGRCTEVIDELIRITYLCDGIVTPLITRVQVENLLRWWSNTYDRRRLYCLGMTDDEIYNCSLSCFEMYERLLKNPYTISNITIPRCKDIDNRTCRVPNPLDEYCGAVLRAINNTNKHIGWTCVTIDWLKNGRRFPHVLREDIKEYLIKEFELVFETLIGYPENDDGTEASKKVEVEVVYEKIQHEIEVFLADFVVDMIQGEKILNMGDPIFFDERLDVDQRAGITLSMKENISIITGPAGSGKTTTLRTLIKNLEINGIKYVVTSFTGKAVIRAKELNGIGENAATMHRIICGGLDTEDFQCVIVDEATMTDAELLYNFLKSFKHKYIMVFIGDINQLPPIKWGSFFNSCIKSRSVPRVKLTSNHRVITKDGVKNGIILNADKITKWPDGELFIFEKADNFIISAERDVAIKDIMVSLKIRGVEAKDVTVISPYRNRPARDGTSVKLLEKLNRLCQLVWNGGNESRMVGDRTFYVGDRVMLIKNNYDVRVFNGQEGLVVGFLDNNLLVNFPITVIRKIDKEEKREEKSEYILENEVVEREDIGDGEERVSIKKIVKIPFATPNKPKPKNGDKFDRDSVSYLDTDLIDHSFALTGHKSQGSEWKYVIAYMPPDSNIESGFNNRNLWYTIMTRGSEMLLLLDPANLAGKAVANRLPYRCEFLTSRLMQRLPRLYEFEKKRIVDDGYCKPAVDDDMPDDLFDDFD